MHSGLLVEELCLNKNVLSVTELYGTVGDSQYLASVSRNLLHDKSKKSVHSENSRSENGEVCNISFPGSLVRLKNSYQLLKF